MFSPELTKDVSIEAIGSFEELYRWEWNAESFPDYGWLPYFEMELAELKKRYEDCPSSHGWKSTHKYIFEHRRAELRTAIMGNFLFHTVGDTARKIPWLKKQTPYHGISIQELFANGIEHGSRFESPVVAHLIKGTRGYCVDVIDSGKGFDAQKHFRKKKLQYTGKPGHPENAFAGMGFHNLQKSPDEIIGFEQDQSHFHSLLLHLLDPNAYKLLPKKLRTQIRRRQSRTE